MITISSFLVVSPLTAVITFLPYKEIGCWVKSKGFLQTHNKKPAATTKVKTSIKQLPFSQGQICLLGWEVKSASISLEYQLRLRNWESRLFLHFSAVLIFIHRIRTDQPIWGYWAYWVPLIYHFTPKACLWNIWKHSVSFAKLNKINIMKMSNGTWISRNFSKSLYYTSPFNKCNCSVYLCSIAYCWLTLLKLVKVATNYLIPNVGGKVQKRRYYFKGNYSCSWPFHQF